MFHVEQSEWTDHHFCGDMLGLRWQIQSFWCPTNPNWPRAFQTLRRRIAEALSGLA